MTVWAVVLAAGVGERFGARKQFAMLGDRRLVDHVVSAASAVCDGVVVVLPPNVDWNGADVDVTVIGGAQRANSVRAGLDAVPTAVDVIVICDAAHPLATPATFRSVIDTLEEGADGTAPGVLVNETVVRVEEGWVREVLPRTELALVQTPCAFRARVLREAYRLSPHAPDEMTLLIALGRSVRVVPGDVRNIHVTERTSIGLAERLL
jgi:2-C-methyl-D-erythritol 4-phosphate cytidylyltransferase